MNHNDTLSLLSLGMMWITAIIILLSVVLKFIEYGETKTNREMLKRSTNPIETFSMTLIIIIIFNNLQWGIGSFSTDFTTRMFAVIYGAVFVLTGTALHIWSKFRIGRYWSNQIEIIEGHSILTTGPYAIVRHPMYSSLILWLFGLSIVFLNYVAMLVTFLVFVPMMVFRANAEDRLLKELDNTSFGVYTRSVSQLIPRFDGTMALLLKLLTISLFGYSLITRQMHLERFTFLFVVHLTTGLILRIPKVRFSYINKSFIMLIIFCVTIFFKPAFWFYYFILIFDIWGLFLNCPCMMIYEKYNSCPCFEFAKKCVYKIKM